MFKEIEDIKTGASGQKNWWHDTYDVFFTGERMRDWLSVLRHRMSRSAAKKSQSLSKWYEAHYEQRSNASPDQHRVCFRKRN